MIWLGSGKSALRVMELLDEAHTNHFGVPEPVQITQNRVEGKAIVVAGIIYLH